MYMSCLFNSLNYFIKEGSDSIRQKVCDYLEENNPIIEGLETMKILAIENSEPKLYIENMRSSCAWGGGIEIQAACNIWNKRIIVKNYRNRGLKDIEFVPVHGKIEGDINIYWTGGHYEPIR